MYQTEAVFSRKIVAENAEDTFRIRYIRDEDVGIAVTETDRAYFLLDSGEYWYDLIQEKYPPVMKCTCKNDLFTLEFDYTPRSGTEDIKEIGIRCQCSACGKVKMLPTIQIDYSPSAHLVERPLTFCKQPKVKYKTYAMGGYWSDEVLLGMADYFVEKGMLAYCWGWESKNKRCVKRLNPEQLRALLIGKERYLRIYFSREPLEEVFQQARFDQLGILISEDVWRKQSVFMLHAPMYVIGYGRYARMEYCSEYLSRDGDVLPKPSDFCALVQDFRKFSKKLLQKKP